MCVQERGGGDHRKHGGLEYFWDWCGVNNVDEIVAVGWEGPQQPSQGRVEGALNVQVEQGAV